MPLTLEQYAAYLDTRSLSWPAPPQVEPPRARPHLVRLPGVRLVLWNVYGTLLAVTTGDLLFEHPQEFVMNVALDKTIQEFKMWGSMSRKPGQPSEYLGRIYRDLLLEQRSVMGGGERYPEVASDRIWEAVIKKLFQKDYHWDTASFGSLIELSRKVAYFFHASLQGTACYPGAARTLKELASKGIRQGILADGQCFTLVQLQRELARQEPGFQLQDVLDPRQITLSHEQRAHKPSERLIQHARELFGEKDLAPEEVLHVGSRLQQDIAPARKAGMKTALFAGDRASLQASPEQLREPACKPDLLITDLQQLTEVLG